MFSRLKYWILLNLVCSNWGIRFNARKQNPFDIPSYLPDSSLKDGVDDLIPVKVVRMPINEIKIPKYTFRENEMTKTTQKDKLTLIQNFYILPSGGESLPNKQIPHSSQAGKEMIETNISRVIKNLIENPNSDQKLSVKVPKLQKKSNARHADIPLLIAIDFEKVREILSKSPRNGGANEILNILYEKHKASEKLTSTIGYETATGSNPAEEVKDADERSDCAVWNSAVGCIAKVEKS